MWLIDFSRVLRRITYPLSFGSMIASAIGIIIMMCVIVGDVFLRAVFKSGLAGTIEIVRMTLIIVVFGGMSYAALAKVHVRVEILINKFSAPVKQSFIVASDLLAIGVIAIISIESFVEAQTLWYEQTTSGSLGIPLAPFAFATGIFMSLFMLTLLVDLLEAAGQIILTNIRNCRFLIPATIISAGIIAIALEPSALPAKLLPGTTGIFAAIILFGLIFLGVHIGAAMAFTTLIGVSYLISPEAGRTILSMTSQTVASDYIWSVFPLFAFLGLLATSLGFGKDIYTCAYKWLGNLPGGLAAATVAGCAAFAAIVGDSTTGVVTMSAISYPEMKVRNYDVKLMTGCICAGGTIGILIPPSIGFIVYGIITEQSIGQLFLAGVLPGILEAFMLILYIYLLCRARPHLGPPGASITFREKFVSLKYSWHVITLFVLIIGGIYTGIFTPYEAAGIGAFASVLIGILVRKITFTKFTYALIEASKMTALLLFIFIYANAIGQLLAVTQAPAVLARVLAGLPLSAYTTLSLILVFYIFLGCVLNVLPGMILTLPILFPSVVALGFDPIWFGVLMVITCEIGVLTPPIGMNVFAMSGIVRDVPIYTMFRGVMPFYLVMLFTLFILVIFPQISLLLPSMMYR